MLSILFRWRLIARINSATVDLYGTDACDALGRFIGLNNSEWKAFTKKLRLLNLLDDENLALALRWITVNAPTSDRLGYNLRTVAWNTYCSVENYILAFGYVRGETSREHFKRRGMLEAAAKVLGLNPLPNS